MRTQPTAEDLGGGVWSVPVPIPGSPLAYTLVYVLESPRGLVLIDAGWQHTDSWNALTGGLRGLGFDVADVRGVIVTHHHPDHAGLAGRVREASGAWIAMHAADVAVIRRFHRLQREGGGLRDWEYAALRRAGASEAEVSEARQSGGWNGHLDPPALADRELADGDLADVPGRTLRVVWTPGHSPGHICLHLEDDGRLFTGDHVLPRITPHIGVYAFGETDTNPLADFLGSLGRVAGMDTTEALPAHEHRFTDVGARASAIAAHHEERLAEVAAIVADACATGEGATGRSGSAAPHGAADGSAAPSGAPGSGSRSVTLWEIASRMSWNMPWADMPPMPRRLAVGEAAAHLRLLEERGLALLLPGSDPLRYAVPAAQRACH